MFHMTLGDYDVSQHFDFCWDVRTGVIYIFVQYDMLGSTPYPAMAKMVFVLFQILIPILLLNMLIAMMGNTYGIVIESAEKQFLKAVKT